MKRALVLGVTVAVLSVLARAAVAAESKLVLTPDKGMIGDLVQGEQAVSACQIYRLHWGGPGGLVLGTDDGSDGRGSVSFRVPDGAGTTQAVVATCQVAAGAEEQIVGGATFTVAAWATSTSRTTVLGSVPSSVPTTLPVTSTTRATSPAPATSGPPTTSRRPPSVGPTTVATTSRTTTTTSPGRRPDVAACERQAADAKAQLVYQPTRQMTVGATYEVVVSLALDASDVPSVVIPGPARTTVVQLRTAECTIEAELTGGADFTVTPPGPVGESFVHTRILTWYWQVTPSRAGPGMRLLLHIKPIVVEDGRSPVPGSDDVHEAVIQVDAQPQSLVAKVNHHVNGFFGNPVATLLLIPGGGGVVTIWVSRRVRRRTSE